MGSLFWESNAICDALRDLVPFVQFKKREKHPCRSVNFSKVTNGIKSLNASHISTCTVAFNCLGKIKAVKTPVKSNNLLKCNSTINGEVATFEMEG